MHISKLPIWLLALVLAAMIHSAGSGQTPVTAGSNAGPLLGALDFQATPERPIGWRGDWTGKFPGAVAPVEWSAQRNVLWRTSLPGESAASPIVVGNRVLVTSNPTDLVCMDKNTGKILWLASAGFFETLTAEEKSQATFKDLEPVERALDEANQTLVRAINAGQNINDLRKQKEALEKKLADGLRAIDKARFSMPSKWGNGSDYGPSVNTPCSDGQHVYVWFASQVAACFDLDGKRLWIRHQALGETPEHGNTISPVLAEGRFIAMSSKVAGFDAKTGEVLWNRDIGTNAGDYASLLVFPSGGRKYVNAPNGAVVSAADGQVLTKGGWVDTWPTPITEGGLVYHLRMVNSRFGGAYRFFEITGQPGAMLKETYQGVRAGAAHGGSEGLGDLQGSPLLFEQLLYTVDETANLQVFDTVAKKELYREKLENPTVSYVTAPGLCASPALAGGRIYVLGDHGDCHVLQAGREFKRLATNTLHPRGSAQDKEDGMFLASPWFDGMRVYLKSQRALYCVGTK